MSRQILFIQGGGAAGTHDNWDSKLVDSLSRELPRSYEVRYPVMPNEADPKYATWKAALHRELRRLDKDAILIGHSIGGTILINTLAEDPTDATYGGVFLIAAPFIGQDGWPSDDIQPMTDLGARLPEQVPIFLYHGTRDSTAPVEHVDLYSRAIPRAIVRRLDERDHQINNDMSPVAADIRKLS